MMICGKIDGFEYCFNQQMEEIELSDDVVEVKDCAFQQCSNLRKFISGGGLKSIGDYVFHKCFSLQEVYIDGNVEKIGKYTFAKCTSLQHIDLSDTRLRTVERGLFDSCYSLRFVGLGDGVNCIEDNSFRNCYNLERVILPKHLRTIGDMAFYGTSLECVDIPMDVYHIGENSFGECSKMHTVCLSEQLYGKFGHMFKDKEIILK